MTKTLKISTETLTGAALLWAIESVDGPALLQPGQLQLSFARDIDDTVLDQLIAKYNVWLEPGHSYNWLANARPDRDPCERMPGETRDDAVLRAIIAVQLGNVVSVPAELL